MSNNRSYHTGVCRNKSDFLRDEQIMWHFLYNCRADTGTSQLGWVHLDSIKSNRHFCQQNNIQKSQTYYDPVEHAHMQVIRLSEVCP